MIYNPIIIELMKKELNLLEQIQEQKDKNKIFQIINDCFEISIQRFELCQGSNELNIIYAKLLDAIIIKDYITTSKIQKEIEDFQVPQVDVPTMVELYRKQMKNSINKKSKK